MRRLPPVDHRDPHPTAFALNLWFCVVVMCCVGGCNKPNASEARASTRPATTSETTTSTTPLTPTTTTEPTVPSEEAPAVSEPVELTAALPFANATLDQDAILAALTDAPVSRFRPVGTSSVVFRATLDGTFDAAFKSNSEKRPRAHAAEVAAYRLARTLGMDNVPPAITRTFSAEAMRVRMTPSAAWNELQSWIGVNAGQVTGAAIYWVPDLLESGIDKRSGARRYTSWLKQGGTITDDERLLARDISNMIAFDCLIGNWDRWSGGNAKGDAAGKRLYIRDHDVAFPGRLSEALVRRMLDRLTPVERFSKGFVARLRQLTRAGFEQELASDPAGASLLDARQIGGMLDRRAAVLSHIDVLIALYGADAVLVFP